jgi:hypothetical protein
MFSHKKQLGTAARQKDTDSGACAVSIKTIVYGEGFVNHPSGKNGGRFCMADTKEAPPKEFFLLKNVRMVR